MECYGGMGKANGLSPDESENELGLSNNDVVDEDDLRKVELLSDEDGREYEDVSGLSAEDIMKKVFQSEERAYEFYYRVGKCNGFGVCKGDYEKDEDGTVVRRRFFCNRAGLRDGKHYNRVDRKRCHRPETRTNCQALMSVYLDKGSSVWKVRKVIFEHNHELIPRGMVHMLRSFRAISGSAKAHMDEMHAYGLPTSKILGYMAGIAGGYSCLGFTKKDAYNYIDRSKRTKVVDGDMNVEEFEGEWAQVAEQYGLLNKYWALQLYEKRKMWANAYLRRKFCAGFRTTSRCEGINSHLKKFLLSRHTFLELV
ncbi:hypothetical protein Ahy_A03g010736 [Arachis hypogaea]|uniref:FAR1 domain-containing protein n=1 Tax=Arachis hypogaea TaxID=3818 RepID=A0A445DNC2_ARAHY|nr:hypothetical protein Ahy_A03g010736 [Arachis hypogaea]